MKYILCLFVLMFGLQLHAQSASKIGKQKTTFTVYGNCEMCKNTIEGVAKMSGATYANWNMATDQLTIEYDPSKVTLELIQRNIAAVGYDNERFKTNAEAYARLPEGCQYKRASSDE